MPPLTNDDVLSYIRIVENLEKSSKETDAVIFQHLLYPDWFRSSVLSNVLVINEKLTRANHYISGNSKRIPSLTESFDAVFETFSEKILEASKFSLKKERSGGYSSTLMLDENGIRLNNKRRGFNPACALLSSVLGTYYKRGLNYEMA